MGTWNPFDPDYEFTGFNPGAISRDIMGTVADVTGTSTYLKYIKYACLVFGLIFVIKVIK